jgi:PEP-CTERM motif
MNEYLNASSIRPSISRIRQELPLIATCYNRKILISSIRLLGVLACTVTLGMSISSAKATPCPVSTSAANISGITCNIGPLEFTFGPLTTTNVGGTQIDLTFNSLANGFSLATTGPVTFATQNSGGNPYASETMTLYYTVTDTSGLIGIQLSGGTLSATASGAGSASSQYACVGCGEYNTRLADIVSSVPGQSESYLTSSFPIGTTSATGYAEPFSLNSDSKAGGSATATWDGTATNFTFEATNLSPTPEPGTLILFGTGLLALAKTRRTKSSS